jgi:hypothetical protein
MTGTLLEVQLNASDLMAMGVESRSEIELPLDTALANAKLGKVSGGHGGSGVITLDIRVDSAARVEEAVRTLRRVLRELGMPPSTTIRHGAPIEKFYGIDE